MAGYGADKLSFDRGHSCSDVKRMKTEKQFSSEISR